MAKKKGKAQQRRMNWQQRFRSGDEDKSGVKERFAPKAAKLPSWRTESPQESLEQFPKQDGMVAGLFPGGVIVRVDTRELLCGISGTFRPPAGSTALTVGDVVTVAIPPQPIGDQTAGDKLRTDGMILSRQTRKTVLARPQPRSGKHREEYDEDDFLKVIVANMDVLLIVASMRQPKLRPALLERFFIVAKRGDMQPLLAINKIDLAPPEAIEEARQALSAISIDPIFVSAATGEGVAELHARLAGRRTVLAGASGVGKSTLINAIIPAAQAATRPIRMKDERGRHTTAAATVYDLPAAPDANQSISPPESAGAGLLVDTPGVRELAVDMDLPELPWYFPEFEPYARACRFNDCTHTHEPNCAVIAAVTEGMIPSQRYESYLRLAESITD